ncbi:putative methyltransferase-domain-containing protein [Gorgonomyces haynaldii]|nr:putative methyltransferase-domain-containing protein [Gorgonomyces haynaldii]
MLRELFEDSDDSSGEELLAPQKQVLVQDYILDLGSNQWIIKQNAGLGTGGQAWEAAEAMCRYIALQNKSFKSVLELGAGTGLVGMFCAHHWNCPVLLTDIEPFVSRFQMHLDNNQVSHLDITGTELFWGRELNETVKSKMPFDLILVADCIYHPDLFQPLVDTLLDVSDENTEIWIAHKVRRKGDKMFWKLLKKHFVSEKIDAPSCTHMFNKMHLYKTKRK